MQAILIFTLTMFSSFQFSHEELVLGTFDPDRTTPTLTTTKSTTEPPCKVECDNLSDNLIRCLTCTKQKYKGKDLRNPNTMLPTVQWSLAIINTEAPSKTEAPKIEPTKSTAYTTSKIDVNFVVCMRCLRRNVNVFNCRLECIEYFKSQSKTTPLPLKLSYNNNRGDKLNNKNTGTSGTGQQSSQIKSEPIAESQNELLVRLLEYKERQFWFIVLAAGCIIVLLFLIVLVLLAQRSKKQKIVDTRIY